MNWTTIIVALIAEGGKALVSWLKAPSVKTVAVDRKTIRVATESHIAASREGKLASRNAKSEQDN